MRLLYQTGRHWPGHRLEVVSGYRTPTVAKNPHSPHMKGLACDFRVEGVKTTELRDYLRETFDKVGRRLLPQLVASSTSTSARTGRPSGSTTPGPGERAVYSENPNRTCKTGRADSYHPTKIDESWVETAAGSGRRANDGRTSFACTRLRKRARNRRD